MKSKIYFIADTHFGHHDIIKYENRPFKDIHEMDAVMIAKWNRIVNVEDEVFVLGDFSVYPKEKTREICTQLNGRKTLIQGNHDVHTTTYYLECGFENVSKYPIILDGFWMLSHEPMYINDHMPYANIFGHVHTNKMYRDSSSQSFCACVERIHYEPIEFEMVKKRMGLID